MSHLNENSSTGSIFGGKVLNKGKNSLYSFGNPSNHFALKTAGIGAGRDENKQKFQDIICILVKIPTWGILFQ